MSASDSKADRNAARPTRPKPLIATRVAIVRSSLFALRKELVPFAADALLDLAQHRNPFRGEQMGEALLRLQPQLDRNDRLGPIRKPVAPFDDLVQRPVAAVDRGVQDLDRLPGLMPPPHRAVRE